MWFAATAAIAEYIYSCNKKKWICSSSKFFFFVSQIIAKESELCMDNEGSRNTLSWNQQLFEWNSPFASMVAKCINDLAWEKQC